MTNFGKVVLATLSFTAFCGCAVATDETDEGFSDENGALSEEAAPSSGAGDFYRTMAIQMILETEGLGDDEPDAYEPPGDEPPPPRKNPPPSAACFTQQFKKQIGWVDANVNYCAWHDPNHCNGQLVCWIGGHPVCPTLNPNSVRVVCAED